MAKFLISNEIEVNIADNGENARVYVRNSKQIMSEEHKRRYG
jgi:hypothetical protein